jgi:hypothetical protein
MPAAPIRMRLGPLLLSPDVFSMLVSMRANMHPVVTTGSIRKMFT